MGKRIYLDKPKFKPLLLLLLLLLLSKLTFIFRHECGQQGGG